MVARKILENTNRPKLFIQPNNIRETRWAGLSKRIA